MSHTLVPPSGSCPKFPSPPYGTCLTSPSRATIESALSGALPAHPQRLGHSWHFNKAKGYKKVETKLGFLVGLSVFGVYTLALSHAIGFPNVLLTPFLWDLLKFLDDYSFPSTNFDSSAPQIITNFSKDFPLGEAQRFNSYALGTYKTLFVFLYQVAYPIYIFN